MEKDEILSALDRLTAIAKARRAECSEGREGSIGGDDLHYLTSDERAERHRLIQLLPSPHDEAKAAHQRVLSRIAAIRMRSGAAVR